MVSPFTEMKTVGEKSKLDFGQVKFEMPISDATIYVALSLWFIRKIYNSAKQN